MSRDRTKYNLRSLRAQADILGGKMKLPVGDYADDELERLLFGDIPELPEHDDMFGDDE